MDLIPDKESLLDLLDQGSRQPVLVSIYIPTHPSSTSQSLNADRSRFKNAIQEAENELEKQGLRLQMRRSILDSAWQLYENLDFWQHRGRALAVFLAPNQIHWYRLPIEVDTLTYVGRQFVLSPLAVAANMPGYHYVIKLDLKQPKLFLASWHMFDEIKLEHMPGQMEEALNISGYEQEQQFSTLGGNKVNGGGAKGQAIYHGHGGAKDNRSPMTDNYFRLVDEAIAPSSLEYPDAPFILAGNGEHTAMFKALCKKNIVHIIKKEIAVEEELKDLVIEYLNNQLELSAEQFISSELENGVNYHDYSMGQLQKMASRGQVKLIGVGLLNSTHDNVRDIKSRITKLDLNLEPDWLKKIEELIHTVLKNGGGVIGTFIKDGQRGVHAVLRYRL